MPTEPKDRVTIREVYNLIEDLREDIKKGYVTRTEFLPVKNIVYGMVGLILASIFTAVLATVIKAVYIGY